MGHGYHGERGEKMKALIADESTTSSKTTGGKDGPTESTTETKKSAAVPPDLKHFIVALDVQQYQKLKLTAQALRDQLALAHDRVTKNQAKIADPRGGGSGGGGMYGGY